VAVSLAILMAICLYMLAMKIMLPLAIPFSAYATQVLTLDGFVFLLILHQLVERVFTYLFIYFYLHMQVYRYCKNYEHKNS